jgi:dTDP-4-dehydrorhamnose 3,5-epimerase
MIFTETPIVGAFLITPERHQDSRGFFVRTYSREEFRRRGLNHDWEECSLSFNSRRGTLRGMHFQAQPHSEAKLIRCTRGAITDIILDLRPNSSSFKAWTSVKLDSENREQLYIPQGLAHGFQTLVQETEVSYQISTSYRPELARGVRWNDPAFDIEWPLRISEMSDRDRAFPDFSLDLCSEAALATEQAPR